MLSQAVAQALKPLYKMRYLALITSIASILAALVSPWLMSQLVDQVTKGTYTDQIYFLIVTIVVAYLVTFALNYASSYVWTNMENKGAGLVRIYLFENVLHKNYRFFLNHQVGDINNKVLNDSEIYAKFRISAMPRFVLNVLQIVIICGVLFTIDLYMTGATVLFSLVFFGMHRVLNKRLRHSVRTERERFSELNNLTNEALQGITTIQLYGVETFFAHRFEHTVDDYEAVLLRYKMLENLLKTSTYTLVGIMSIFAIFSGIFFSGMINVTVSGIVAFYLFLPHLSEPIKALAQYSISSQNARAVKKRLEELLATEIREEQGLEIIEHIEQLELRDLGFAYENPGYHNQEQVLHDVNITLNRGDAVAVIGRSGTGKSTLLRLLKKQVDPTHGQILINGKATTDIDRGSYLKRISVLLQEPFMFDGNLAENIAFGQNYPEKVIRDAAELSCMSHFSMDESAIGLSGGERQRVGLARALACEFDVLILDEPTSELDKNTENRVIENLKQLQQERQFIMIVVTHSENVLTKLCNKQLHL